MEKGDDDGMENSQQVDTTAFRQVVHLGALETDPAAAASQVVAGIW
jgi:hypothetical protein